MYAQISLHELIYNEIKNDITKVHRAIANANQNIEILEMQNNSNVTNSLLLQSEIETIAEELVKKLSNFIKTISEKAYNKTYKNLTETWTNVLGITPEATNDDLINREIYDTIHAWTESLKKWLLDNINTAFDELPLNTKSYLKKGFLSNFFENVKDFFGKIKEKVDTLIQNVVSSVQTTALKIAFKAQRVEEYQIVFSGNPNACEKSQQMDEKIHNIDELVVGVTAPPFHPNCGCTMIPYIWEEKEGSLREQIFIDANIAFELLAQIGFLEDSHIYNWIKSSIWRAGSIYLESINCPLAREMYTLGMYGEGKGMSEKATNLMIEAMKNSKRLQDKIFELTESGKDFDTGNIDFGFTKDEDEGLYYAVQNVNMRIIGTKIEDDNWNIKVMSWDQYDFTTFRNSLAFADLANNLGEAMQRNGMMTEYNTYTEYEYVWQRR